MKKALTAIAVITMLQSACSTAPKADPRFTIGKPYTEEGKTYYPTVQPEYKEIGMASWYGPGFHNRLTANGEVFNQNLMTAAHRTLPLPSIVKVTNLENGRSAYVRINDRGPFKRGRIIDLSKQAAASLGLMNKGEAKVLVELEKNASATALNSVRISEDEKKYVLSQLQGAAGEETEIASNSQTSTDQQAKKQFSSKDQGTSPSLVSESEVKEKNEKQAEGKVADLDGKILPRSLKMKQIIGDKSGSASTSESTESKVEKTGKLSGDGNYYVQIQAATNKAKAEEVAKRFDNKLPNRVEEANVNGQNYYRVQLGGFETGKKAIEIRNSLKSIGYNDSFIVKAN